MVFHKNNAVEIDFIHTLLKLENNMLRNYLTVPVSPSLKTKGLMAESASI